MRLYNVHTLEQTEEKIKHHFNSFKTEERNIDACYHRILAEDIYAKIDVPTFNRSTVDGYAVRAKDTNGASDTMPMLLKNLGEVEMGEDTSIVIKEDTCCYVPTGGLVPQGADAMVMIEYTEDFDGEIAVLKTITPLQNIVHKGDDVNAGHKILSKGTKLTSRHIGVLAATGIFDVLVYTPIRVSIISTGDELITTEQALNRGEVFDINTHTIKQHCKVFDLHVINTFVLKDDYQLIKKTMSSCISQSDIMIISGGSSVGHKDYTADIIDDLAGGQGVLIHGLAIKPGKPTIVGKVDEKLVIGLPGHPVSALMVFDQLMRMYLSNISDYSPKTKQGYLTQNIHSAPGKATFVMVRTDDNVTPILGKSGMITLLSNADGYIKINANDEGLDQGDQVTVYQFE